MVAPAVSFYRKALKEKYLGFFPVRSTDVEAKNVVETKQVD
jgi:hypothetical protein